MWYRIISKLNNTIWANQTINYVNFLSLITKIVEEVIVYKHIKTVSLTMSSISNPTKNILYTLTIDNTTTCVIALNEVAAVFKVLAIETSWEAIIFKGPAMLIFTAKRKN